MFKAKRDRYASLLIKGLLITGFLVIFAIFGAIIFANMHPAGVTADAAAAEIESQPATLQGSDGMDVKQSEVSTELASGRQFFPQFSGGPEMEQQGQNPGDSFSGEPETNVTFGNFSYNQLPRGFSLSGRLYLEPQGTGLEDVSVKLYCNDKHVYSKKSGADGWFSVNGNCNIGDDAYLIVNYGGKTYESQHATVDFRYKVHRIIIPSVPENPAGVPEFSTFTLAMAVCATALGLIIFRKSE
jgi:hypothetical protein